MLYKLDEYDVREIIKSARLLNGNRKIEEQDIKDFKKIGDNTYIEIEDLLSWIENLNYELEHTQDMLIDMTNDLESNYRNINRDDYDFYGVSRKDFM